MYNVDETDTYIQTETENIACDKKDEVFKDQNIKKDLMIMS